MSELGASLRYFSGDDGDHRAYRRWRQWVLNKMAVMDKLPKEARGSFIWTLLQGRALETVEHLREDEYQKEGGDLVLLQLLDKRWPQKDRSDEIGEHITEIFSMRGKEGESIRQWCARSQEVFDRCGRKTGVQFPEEVKGYIALYCSGLSEEQRALVLARTQGGLKFETISQSMRSCFPEFVIPKRRSAVGMVADEAGLDDPGRWLGGLSRSSTPSMPEHEEASGFQDENEIAEVLATTWPDKRQELNRLNKARKFHQAGELRRSFRVEIEELKKRTKCRNCGKTGHWARECRSKKTTASPSTDFKNGVSYVESFVGMVGVKQSMLEQLRLRRQPPEIEIALVSSPGFAVLDSGCGKTIIGRQTLEEFRRIWDGYQVSQPEEIQEVNHFRFGNGQSEKSCSAINMPVAFGGKTGNVHACIVHGSAPLLLSRPAMKKLRAVIDFDKDNSSMLDGEVTIPIQTNEAGQYVVNVTCFDKDQDPGQTRREPFTLHSCDEQRDSIAAVSSILPSGDDVAASPAPSNDRSVNVTVVGPIGVRRRISGN